MTDAAALRLKKRHAAETRFRMYGRVAIIVALSFLVLLLGRIGMQGYSTFTTNTVSLPVYLDPSRIDRADLEGSNYDYVVALSLLKRMGETEDEFGTASGDAMNLVSRDLGFQILDKIKADPTLIGKTITVTGPVKADADLYYKGELKRSTDQADRKLNDRQLAWLDRLKKSGAVTSGFNVGFFTQADSTEPEQAGILGAIIGSRSSHRRTAGPTSSRSTSTTSPPCRRSSTACLAWPCSSTGSARPAGPRSRAEWCWR